LKELEVDKAERDRIIESFEPIIELARKINFCEDYECIYPDGMHRDARCLVCGEKPSEQELRDMDADNVAKERRERYEGEYGVGWKVFVKVEDGLYEGIYYLKNSYQQGQWYEDWQTGNILPSRPCDIPNTTWALGYMAGYHIFANHKDAMAWAGAIRPCVEIGSVVVARVHYQDVVASGWQSLGLVWVKKDQWVYDLHPVIVARRMKIVEEVLEEEAVDVH